MAYASYEDFTALYGGDTLDEAGFARLIWEAERLMDGAVTGVDGVVKLRAAAPVREQDREAVRRCACALVDILRRDEQTEGLVGRSDGSVAGRVVTAVTAGSESVSYAVPAAATAQERQARIGRTLERFLAGVPDANGVNLLYMGRYPARL